MELPFKALADPTRRRILQLLGERDMTAGEIASEFPVAWASVSHHLSVLRNASLVLAERNGQNIWYSLNTTVFQDAVAQLIALVPARRKVKPRA